MGARLRRASARKLGNAPATNAGTEVAGPQLRSSQLKRRKETAAADSTCGVSTGDLAAGFAASTEAGARAAAGVGADVVQKLRKGQWSIQRQVDLHGLRSDEAREAMGQFIRDAHKQGLRCVRVVHGKGLGSPGKAPVLKDKVLRWLVQKAEVIAFVQAPPHKGGAGAVLVLLAPVRHTSGR